MGENELTSGLTAVIDAGIRSCTGSKSPPINPSSPTFAIRKSPLTHSSS